MNKEELDLIFTEEELRQFVRFARVCSAADIPDLANDAIVLHKKVKELESMLEDVKVTILESLLQEAKG